jgi:hypothetical protein
MASAERIAAIRTSSDAASLQKRGTQIDFGATTATTHNAIRSEKKTPLRREEMAPLAIEDGLSQAQSAS